MRVVAGKFKSRKLNSISSETTRPTLDRVKESLFSIISDKIYDAVVLDLFAGSGALGLEAISRGAKYCFLVDDNIKTEKVITQNFRGVDNYKFLNCEFKVALDKFEKQGQKFDIVFLDPPYESSLGYVSLDILARKNLLKDNGIVIFETKREKDLISFPKGYIMIQDRAYGNVRLVILEKSL